MHRLEVSRNAALTGRARAAGASGTDRQPPVEVIMSQRYARPASLNHTAFAGGAFAVALGLIAILGVRELPRGAAATWQATDSAAALRARRLAEQTRPRHEIPFKPAEFDKFVGYYELSPTMFCHIFRRGDRYFAQLTGQPPVREYPQSPRKFFATVVAAQISFRSGPGGRVSELVLHQNGFLRSAPRVSARRALRAESQLLRRIRRNIPAPGTAAAVRAQILSFERYGHARYAQMAPALAAAAHTQASRAAPLFKSLGAFHSLRHFKVLANGADDYLASFAHGRLEVIIAPLAPDGKVQGIFFRPEP